MKTPAFRPIPDEVKELEASEVDVLHELVKSGAYAILKDRVLAKIAGKSRDKLVALVPGESGDFTHQSYIAMGKYKRDTEVFKFFEELGSYLDEYKSRRALDPTTKSV